MGTLYCEKCCKTLNEDQFYGSNNLEKYPTGKLKQCKKCITMHVDNWNQDTYLWILQEADVPWVPEEWNKLMLKYGKDRSSVTGTTIIGRYLAKMRLKQFKDFRWKDNEFLQQLNKNKIEQTMRDQGYDIQEITLALEKASIPLPEKELLPPPIEDYDPYAEVMNNNPAPEEEYDLTEEDKVYLKLKWGKNYKPHEWVRLEQLYQEMMNSYDIQTAGDLDTLKLVCKTSLKANQLLDIGDIDGAQKTTKMYESLMKSGKWTAAQNKLEENELVDSIGELVAICEKDGFIPKYYKDGPKDYADRVIEDLQRYTHDLIMNESGLGIMLENAIKQIEEEKEAIEQAANRSEEDDIAELFNYDVSIIEKEDYEEFEQFELDLEESDNEFLNPLGV